MTAPASFIAALDDKDAVQVLALVLDHQGLLPDGPTLRQKTPQRGRLPLTQT